MERMEIAMNIKSILLEKRIYQTELAARLGMDYQSLCRAVNGRRPIYAEELARFSEAIGVSVERLLGLSA